MIKTMLSPIHNKIKNVFTVISRNGGLTSLAKKCLSICQTKGWGTLLHKCLDSFRQPLQPNQNDYNRWIACYDRLDEKKRLTILSAIGLMPHKPTISVIMPVYDPPLKFFKQAIESIKSQLYPCWELCIADDCSNNEQVRRLIMEYAAQDSRIKYCFRETNGHISQASNSALQLASGDFIALLDQDDLLPEHALFEVAKAIQAHPEASLFYSDEDKMNRKGLRTAPYFKPDWNPDLFLSQNLFSHLGVYKRALINQAGGFREGFEGSQDYDLALRCVEIAGHNAVHHIPQVLYHWRIPRGRTAKGRKEKSHAFIAAMQAVREHLARQGIEAEVLEADSNVCMPRVRYILPDNLPKVSILIPTRNMLDLLRNCISSLLEKTVYSNYEVLIIDNGSDDKATLSYLDEIRTNPRVRVLRDDSPFNYSALNNKAVAHCDGEIICLLNNDIEVINSDWLTEMVSQAIRPEIGAVGAKLFYPNDLIQHAGVILGLSGVAGHLFTHNSKENTGYFHRAALVQNFSAVTAACMVLRRSVFMEVGGLNEDQLKVSYNDVDLCLRIQKAGYRNLYTPFAQLYHYESASRGSDLEAKHRLRFENEKGYMIETYGEELLFDRAYNPNLSLSSPYCTMAFPPRERTMA